ncbi:alanine/glycine:cation symporter family protein [Salinicoccus hispanicus]|uniref:Amino acid carrier protein n=1 Tax=Salinicoccus hispanicus TaxID=157225 RepID=A0A6N8U1S4_9STAP|nr:alanine/glycine:cation symporter family protein [Salinicoccus hispanicus]MXQ50886.1 amino acid carrier protein [Salinicoccus hispanicus]
MQGIVDVLNGWVWSSPLVYGLLAVGLYFSLRMRFFQIRHFKEMIRLMFQGEKSPVGISSFQALAVSLSGRVGTGNIVGVATAIFIGGPGAIFWMWLIAFLGAGSAFVESTLAQIYKQNEDKQYRGGPAYYIEKGIGGRLGKVYAIVFALVTILATGFLLPGIQSNSIAGSMTNSFPVQHWVIGAALVVLVGLVIFGGIRSIANVASAVVPFMALIYVGVAIVVVIMNIQEVPAMFGLIFRSAFGLEQQFGGIVGAMIAIGVQRGIYSNEAGQGTGPHAAGAAEVSHPAKQGLVQAFSVYVDTLFVCTATALMILMTGMYNVSDGNEGLIVDSGVHQVSPGGEENFGGTVAYTQAGLDRAFSGQDTFDINFVGFGSYFISFALLFFCYTTILAYYYIAETNLVYLTHGRWPILKILLGVLLIGSVFYGTVSSAGLAWDMGDLGVGLMAWLNVIAILILQKPALAALRDFERQKKEKGSGKYAVYTPDPSTVKEADFWHHDYPQRLREEAEYNPDVRKLDR